MRYVMGDKIINVSRGAYESIYKDMGFLPTEEEEPVMIEITNGETILLVGKKEYERTYKDIGFLPVADYQSRPPGGHPQEDVPQPLQDLSLSKLKSMAKYKGILGYSQMSKEALIEVLSKVMPEKQEVRDDPETAEGSPETPET